MWHFKHWPEGLSSPDGSEVPKFRREHAQRAMFYAFFAWAGDRGEVELNQQLKTLGIQGLIRTLAVARPPAASNTTSTKR